MKNKDTEKKYDKMKKADDLYKAGLISAWECARMKTTKKHGYLESMETDR